MRTSHRLQAVLVAAIWGVNFVVIDVGLRDLPPLILTAMRFIVAAVPLVFLVPRPTARIRYIVGYGLILGVAKFGVLFTAMSLGMAAGLASLVLQAQALVSVLLAAVLLRERPSRHQVAGVLTGSAGIALLAVSSGGRATIIGFALTLCAAVSWAVANVVVRASGETRPLSLLVWSSLVPPIPLIGLAGLVDGPRAVVDALLGLSWSGLLAVGYVAYVSTLVGFGLWNRLIGEYSVARVAPFSLLVPVFGLTASWTFLGERVGATELLAAGVVLVGLALILRRWTPARSTYGPYTKGSRRPSSEDGRGVLQALRVRFGASVDPLKLALLGDPQRGRVCLVGLEEELGQSKVAKGPVYEQPYGPRGDALATAGGEHAVGDGGNIIIPEL